MSERSGSPADRALEEHVRAALAGADPVPDHVRAGAIAAFAARTLDAELAELAYDSLLDQQVTAGVRGDGGPRLLTFSAPALTVEVEVVDRGRTRRVVGQLVPPASGRVEVRHRDGVVATDADEIGRFAVGGVAPGPVRIRCDLGSSRRPVETDWVTL